MENHLNSYKTYIYGHFIQKRATFEKQSTKNILSSFLIFHYSFLSFPFFPSIFYFCLMRVDICHWKMTEKFFLYVSHKSIEFLFYHNQHLKMTLEKLVWFIDVSTFASSWWCKNEMRMMSWMNFLDIYKVK